MKTDCAKFVTNTQLKVLQCHVYDDLRQILIDKSERRDNSFRTKIEAEKLRFILKYEERENVPDL